MKIDGTEPRTFNLRDIGVLDGSPDSVFDGIVRLAGNVVSAERAVLLVGDDDTDTLLVRASWGETTGELPIRTLLARNSITSDVRRSGAVVAITGDMNAQSGLQEARAFGMRSFLAAPVHGAAGETIGALVVMRLFPRRWQDSAKCALTDLAKSLSRDILLRASLATLRLISEENLRLQRERQFRSPSEQRRG